MCINNTSAFPGARRGPETSAGTRRSAWLEGATTMDVARLLAISLHTLAFVVAWGYYGILGRIMLPALERSLDRPAQVRTLVTIERIALPLILLSTALFVITGTYLLFDDPRYAGLGNFFANTWTALMLVKHLIVVVLIALGVAVDLLIRRAGRALDEVTRTAALRAVRWSAEGATGLGALIVLLTAAAQLST
jgi:uncharacterized membrane protein